MPRSHQRLPWNDEELEEQPARDEGDETTDEDDTASTGSSSDSAGSEDSKDDDAPSKARTLANGQSIAPTTSDGQSGDGEGEQGSNNAAAASTTCKKGVGYNDAKYTEKLDICWGYNWASTGEIKQGAMYIPMLFNEPDLAEQAHMSPSEAAELWKSEIESFSSFAKLVSPAVTNGVKADNGSPMGVPWLQEFMSACDGCTIDAVALHWYDSAENTDYFTAYLTEAQAKLMKPIWLTEFMGTGTPEAQKKFLEFAVPWLDDQDWIERYAAFGCFKDNEVANFIASDDGSLNELGQAYSDAK
ncbi:hypothetical protein Rhopal_002700-T1 [Rhodotorula paludigena]|uniref:Asl1-like glycosyl hydrolase catalytic domain-containing protein n=1 Tax=Rhodotorula paludigena TaxID=86838 RepID=A0AAV5GHV9_9BASI|nr:hypothetical protein Rhopal_002700-T1 [Rhodotorula paludigena]